MEMINKVKRGRGRPRKYNINSFRFFKIILPFIFQQNMLKIPDIFAEKLNYRFPTTATLCTPLGRSWKISVCKRENNLYFTKGWEEFMKQNSISVGFFLVFECMDNLHFRVNIFDLSCCEIDYIQLSNNSCKVEELVEAKEEVEESKTKIEV